MCWLTQYRGRAVYRGRTGSVSSADQCYRRWQGPVTGELSGAAAQYRLPLAGVWCRQLGFDQATRHPLVTLSSPLPQHPIISPEASLKERPGQRGWVSDQATEKLPERKTAYHLQMLSPARVNGRPQLCETIPIGSRLAETDCF